MVAKPTKHTDWASANSDPGTNIVEPSLAKKQEGWISGGEKPPYQTFNWIQKTQDEWNKYLEQETDRNLYGQFTLADNQAAAANVTNLIADKTKYQNWSLEAYVFRNHVDLAGIENTAFSTNLGTSFDTFARKVKLHPNGNLVVGGEFNTLGAAISTGVAMIDTDGNEIASFSANLGSGLNNIVKAIDVQPDGKILVGGLFTTFNGNTRNYLIRLNADGTEDTTFYTNLGTGFNSSVESIKVLSSGKIMIGGQFTTFDSNGVQSIARLNSTGTEDTAFSALMGVGFNNIVYDFEEQTDGKILVGGLFTTFKGLTRNYLIRLDSLGNEDTAFYGFLGSSFNNTVSSIAVQQDGSIVVGGSFTSLNGNTRAYLVRLNSTGTEDTAFYTSLGIGFNSSVESLEVQADGKIIVGGTFTSLNGATRNRLVRLNTDGSENAAFYTNLGTGFGSSVLGTLVLSDDSIICVGAFTSLNGSAREYAVRLNGDIYKKEKAIFTIEKNELENLVLTELHSTGDDSGVDLFIDETTGQVSYTSSNVGGTLVTSELYYALRNDKLLYREKLATSAVAGIVKSDVDYITDADETTKGLVDTEAQTFAGVKTFSDYIISLGGLTANGLFPINSVTGTESVSLGSPANAFISIATTGLYRITMFSFGGSAIGNASEYVISFRTTGPILQINPVFVNTFTLTNTGNELNILSSSATTASVAWSITRIY